MLGSGNKANKADRAKGQTSIRSFFSSPSVAKTPSKASQGTSDATATTPLRRPLDADPEEEDVKTPQVVVEDVPLKSGRVAKRVRYVDSDDDEAHRDNKENQGVVKKSTKARKRAIVDDDDSGDDYKGAENESESDDDESAAPTSEESEASQEDEEEDVVAVKTPRNKFPKAKMTGTPMSTSSVPRTPATPLDRLKAFSNPSSASKRYSSPLTQKSEKAQKFKEKNEERYGWLVDVKDASGNRPGDADYDPRTLYVPPAAWKKFTPFEQQFWEIKKNHWDTVVFFKKGKFYELYEKDADIGHQQFDLKMTDRVNMRMVGVPEMSFDHWASQFIAKGYKVAKVEQMENAIGKTIRAKNESKREDKIIRRELTSILTSGTLVDAGMLTNDMSTYCMSIKEYSVDDGKKEVHFGVAFVDTATSAFGLCALSDDTDCTQLETLLLQLKPKELVLEKGKLSPSTLRCIKNNLKDSIFNFIIPEREFWDHERAAVELNVGEYFGDGLDSNKHWPSVLQNVAGNIHTMSAFGGLLWYLKSLKLDKQLLTARNFVQYDPVRHGGTLVLDGQTLKNLQVFENTEDGGDFGTLFRLLNRCETPFGKRLFKLWLCHPLRSAVDINDRLDAIDDLNENLGLQERIRAALRPLPDIERIISRTHAGHCRVKEFVAALSAFKQLMELFNDLQTHADSFNSQGLRKLSTLSCSDHAAERLAFFDQAFDHKLAAAEDNITPFAGFDKTFDHAQGEVDRLEAEFQAYAHQQQKALGCKVTFKDVGKEIYQMEIPAKIKVPQEWVVMSRTQAVCRYYTPRIRDLVGSMLEAREIRDEAARQNKWRMYQRFDEDYEVWLKVIKAAAELDCLLGLAQARMTMGEPACRPVITEEGCSVFRATELRHPCLSAGIATDFIPNDVQLGGGSGTPNMVLLTGPNMGGKSTLLRQICVAVIMAQLGCYVPAASCELTPFDRIFTRIGANDNILAGQSTFMVELAETSKILEHASERSLVILDELGRGTSTYDGFAIAYSVLQHLTSHIGCLGLFSTHYGALTKEFETNPLVGLRYMSFHSDDEKREVTFLYKLAKGACPKSYGMNVATLAGVPEKIVKRADDIAATFQANEKLKNMDNKRMIAQLPLTRLAAFKALVDLKGVPADSRRTLTLKNVWASLQSASPV